MMRGKNKTYATDCPVTYALNIIGGKWHIPIIWALSQTPVLRYNELKRQIKGITNMMLTQSLKEMEGYGLIRRIQYPEIPPRVEYSLTQVGLELLPAIDELAKWGVRQMTVSKHSDEAILKK